MRDHLLAIDCGTQSLRALLFDARGTLVHTAQVALEPYRSPEPGWAEQDPEEFWDALTRACHTLWERSTVPADAVAAVSLTTQRGTVVNVDEQGRPLRPAILWLDQRRVRGTAPVGGAWGILLRLAGMREALAYVQSEAEVNWIRNEQPEIWRRTHKYLLLSGFLAHRLTGRFADSTGSQVGYLPFDSRRQQWASSTDWKWTALPVEREKLPELIAPGEPIGEISPAASAATGIPAGVPLIAAAADKACESLGSGCIAPSIAGISYGTTATIDVTSGRYREVRRFFPPYPAAAPGRYSLEVQLYRGFWVVRWFKEQFGAEEVRRAGEEGSAPEVLLDRLAAEIPPGSMGLMLQPYWSPGLKEPGPEAKGAVIGFGDVHTRAHLYRAILEGIAYGLREGSERIQRATRVPIRELRVAGGGSRSDVAMQITADVFGLPAARPHTPEASGLGAAILAAVGTGLHPDIETAAREMTRVGRVFEPQPEAAQLYEVLYRRVYLRMYERLQPLYAEIREITGYPAPPG